MAVPPIFRVLWMLAVVGACTLLTSSSQAGDRDGSTTPESDAPVSGSLLPGMEPFDEAMREFFAHHQVPGAAVAVVERGRLVLSRGYGVADKETATPVRRDSLFRIASLSKPITAVAVLHLAQKGVLDLDAPVMEILGATEICQGVQVVDERLDQVTIRHLLEHRGGWDRDASFDPMFRSVEFAEQLQVAPPAGPTEVIRAMLAQPLDFAPGERYAYSNFGYCLLGRVIEQVSGQEYEQYVREQVLAPMGIRSMKIGRTRLADRAEHEVRYYDRGRGGSVFAEDLGSRVPSPDGAWYLEAMDAHGGWIATADDLARFATRLDCVLGPRWIDEMYARPDSSNVETEADATSEPADVYYSLGWQNRVLDAGRMNHWHTGSLPGTTALLIMRHDGKTFVALVNTRNSPHTRDLASELDQMLHKAAAKVDHWPEGDLF